MATKSKKQPQKANLTKTPGTDAINVEIEKLYDKIRKDKDEVVILIRRNDKKQRMCVFQNTNTKEQFKNTTRNWIAGQNPMLAKALIEIAADELISRACKPLNINIGAIVDKVNAQIGKRQKK